MTLIRDERLNGLPSVDRPSSDAVVCFDAHGTIVLVNADAQDLFGYTEQQMIGLPAGRLIPEAVGGSVSAENVGAQRSDGSVFACEIAVTTVAAGAASMTIASIRSVTPIELPDGELFLQQVTGSVHIGFSLRRIGSNTFHFVNPALRTILGWDQLGPAPTLNEVVELMHPDYRSTSPGASQSVENGARIDVEYRILRADGEQRWIRATADPVWADEKVIAVAATYEDVTDRINIELALRQSEEQFVQLGASLDVGVALRELDPPRFLYVNEAYTQIVGNNPTRPGTTAADALSTIHPDDRERFHADYWAHAAIGQATEIENRVVRPDGEVRWVHVISRPVRNAEGKVFRVAGTVEDITARKNVELELRASRLGAEQANASKNDFLSRMSHELRTPLNAVLGFGQLLELDDLTASQAEAVDHILKGGRHVLAMINDVLDIARIESDHLDLSLEPVSVEQLLDETVGLMQPISGAANISLGRTDAQSGENYVRADRRRLQQVLLNLLTNAIKYNHPGGRVHVSTSTLSDKRLCINVIDNGLGIAPENMPKLFTPFDRLGQEGSGIDGSGIGLALTQRLVQIMDGTLEVTSRLGQGSTFTVVLPLTGSLDSQITSAESEDDADSVASTDQSTILYIEDNPANVQLMKAILRHRAGWSLLHASDGSLGVGLARTAQPTLILLDVNLPDADGVDVLNALRASPVTAHIPVVAVSADASARQANRMTSAGALHYLSKPLSINNLLTILDGLTT